MNQNLKVSFSKITFSGLDEFVFEPNDKIILVGPNNSGKSQTLKELLLLCDGQKINKHVVVKSIELAKIGNSSDLQKCLDENAEYVQGYYRYRGWQYPANYLHYWDQPMLTHGLKDGFIKIISADNRLSICRQQDSISLDQAPSNPQHVLYDSEELMSYISSLFKRAFGMDLMLDFRGGNKIPFHVGDTPGKEFGNDRVSDSYVKKVRENPLLDLQGDGMKSYAGILFEAIISKRDITLIDEPEAFLHPPQMRKLGETLASEVDGQLIVATHSSDVLRGFLEGTKGNVRILRVRRSEINNKVYEAPVDVIKELWTKPEIRYSNALEGIFHEQTILCEDDSDCRLYNSIADHVAMTKSEQWKDTAYVPIGGKHGVPKVAAILRKIGVPIKAVFDIDFLSEKNLVQSTIEAFGGDWNEIEPLWCRVDSAVRSGIKPKTNKEIKESIIAILRECETDALPKKNLVELMKQNSPWTEVKKFGASAIPRGDGQREYVKLINCLENIGVYLVPVGEIEGFYPEVGSHGPKYVTNLLSTISLSDCKLEELRKFVEIIHKGNHCSL